jgi:site-specific DNA-methyltransferase (adenine-specific)
MLETNKVYRMDCLEGLKQLPNESVDLIVTDPPYNIAKSSWDTIDNFIEWLKSVCLEIKRVLKKNGSFYLFCSQLYMAKIDLMLQDIFIIQNRIIWNYRSGRGARKKYVCRYEPIFFCTKSKDFTFNLDEVRIPHRCPDKRNNPIGRNPTDVWDIDRLSMNYKEFIRLDKNVFQKNGHIPQKPIKLIERMILASSNQEDLVLDCFMGSGTTAVASINLKRNFVGFEINEDYHKVIQNRLSETPSHETLLSQSANAEDLICVKEEFQK